jgi:hypothetical protein
MNKSFRQPSRRSDLRRLADLIPGRLARFATLTVALTATGLAAGCSTASSSESAAVAPKTGAASSAASAGSSATPTSTASPVTASPVTASPATASPATASPAPVSTAGNGTQLGTYTITLTNGYSAALGPSAPTQAQIAANGSCDVQYNGDIYSCNYEKIISLPSGSTPTYSACTTGTLFETSPSVAQGTAFCIIETGGRVAGVTIATVGTSPSNYVNLSVTVWKYVS